MIEIFDFFIFFAGCKENEAKESSFCRCVTFFYKMAKNRLTAKTPHCVRRTVRRLNADFYHIL